MLGLTAALVTQTDRTTASARRQIGASLAVAEGGADRVMLELSRRHNSILLSRNYDPINPRTGRNYLGADAIPNSTDETTTALDEWTGFNPSSSSCYQQAGVGAPTLNATLPLTGTLGVDGRYTLRAYRYNPRQQSGVFWIEGTYRGQSTALVITVVVKPDLEGFPGIVGSRPWPVDPAGVVALRGRHVLGRNGNIYAVTGSPTASPLVGQAPANTPRPQYIDYLWSAAADGGTGSDHIGGKIEICDLEINIPPSPSSIVLGVVDSDYTFTGTNASAPTVYQIDEILLNGDEVITIDTTNGPVTIEVTNVGVAGISLYDNAKIRNIRTDGRPPRVGDARIMIRGNRTTYLFNQSCIENLFIYSFLEQVEFLTTGAGCPSGRNTNFEGVIWAESIISSKNNVANRNINYLNSPWPYMETLVTPGATSGIYVPEDVSSLTDLLRYTKWPTRYRFGGVIGWQQVRL
jgi:hypothetical protein